VGLRDVTEGDVGVREELAGIEECGVGRDVEGLRRVIE
jgi:hypothetical protein